jgi:Protein of unknown function (DUF3592)
VVAVDSSNLWANWQPPRELLGGTPRQVRLASTGVVLLLFWTLLTLVVIAVCLSLARDTRRKEAGIHRMFAEGRETEGAVKRLWVTRAKSRYYHVIYRYWAEGVQYESAPTLIAPSLFESLRFGSSVAVLYLPSDPTTSFLKANPPHVGPAWLPFILVVPTGLGAAFLGFVPIFQARSFLAYGQPAPAVITGVTKQFDAKQNQIGFSVAYEFPVLGGGPYHGNFHADSAPPAEGSVICIVYDPGNPRRSRRYPSRLARVASV